MVKLADFGLARDMLCGLKDSNGCARTSTGAGAAGPRYTTKVVTRWFRAPEISLEDPNYTEKIDVWSIGCTFVEMISRKTLFASVSDLDHFPTIIRQLQANDALPSERDWPGLESLFKRSFPNGLPPRPPQKDRAAGGIRNFFRNLPSSD